MSNDIFDFDDVQEGEERVGGFSLLASDVHGITINQAYMIQSKNGALGVVLDVQTDTGHKHNETFYVTNAKKEPYYMKDGKKHMLSSMQTINNLCKLLGFEKGFNEVYKQRVKKAGVVYDWESRKEITKELPMLIKLCGKKINAAIVHRKENKNKLVGGKYIPTNDAREFNLILAFVDRKTNRTATEMADNKDAEYVVDFLDKFKGQVDDRFKPVETDYEEDDTQDPLSDDDDDDFR